MFSISFTISIIIVIKIWSYSTLRRPSTDLSSTYDTMPENPHMEFSTAFFHNLWKTLQEDTWEIGTPGTVVSYYTLKGIRFLRFFQVQMIHSDVSNVTWTFWCIKLYMYQMIHRLFQYFLIDLGGWVFSELIHGRGSVEDFLEKSYPWLYTLILT